MKFKMLAYKSSWVASFTLVIGLIAAFFGYVVFRPACRPANCAVKESGTSQLRILHDPTWDLHYRFNIQTRQKFERDWRTIYTSIREEPILRDADHIDVITEDILYFFSERIYGVSLDKGATWSYFDVYDSTLADDRSKGLWITDVEVYADGTGRMSIYLGGRYDQSKSLHTNDFGRNWIAP